jgi:hypothetical protein
MNYRDLFKNGSLKWIKDFVGKIIYDGLGADITETSKGIVLLLSALIVVFCLYKLVWLVWNTMKFIINCLSW